MTRKDYIKEQFNLLKIVMTAFIGAMFAIFVYNIQSSGSNIIIVLPSLMILGFVLIKMGRAYKGLLDEIKALP